MTFDRKTWTNAKIWSFTEGDFEAALERSEEPVLDKFAKTFLAKGRMIKRWVNGRALWVDFGGGIDPRLTSAIIITISKRKPAVANLQLLHTFAFWRRLGFAKRLTMSEIERAHGMGASHLRVSSEPGSVEFYRALGFRFWGKQKSGTLLSMFRFGEEWDQWIHDPDDPVIRAAVTSGRRGCVVEPFEGGPK